MMPKDDWVDIEGYFPYKINRNGDIINSITNKLKHKSLVRDRYTVSLNGKTLYIHRLVAKTFIPNPNNYEIVNHIDENPLNNNVDNLEWCTQKDNVRHGTCQQRRIEKVSKGKIIQYDKQGNIIKIWNSLNSLRLNGHVAAWRAITRGNTNRFHDNSFWFRETERFDITKGKCLTLNIK